MSDQLLEALGLVLAVLVLTVVVYANLTQRPMTQEEEDQVKADAQVW